MDYEKLYTEMLNYRNEEQAEKMSSYMLNKFKHIGIRTPERRKIFKDFFKEYKKEQEKSGKIDWDFINNCWKNEYRELQYSALDYLQAVKDILTDKDIPKLKTLALSKPWWDTIDCLDMIIGGIALKYPKVNDIILQWSTDENIWLRRIAIDHQLLRKEKTANLCDLLFLKLFYSIRQTESCSKSSRLHLPALRTRSLPLQRAQSLSV